MRCRRLVGALVSAGMSSNCAWDLDNQIGNERERIAALSREIERAFPQSLKSEREVLAELRYRPVQLWLRHLSSPEFNIAVVGIDGSRRGDLRYYPGSWKAWINPERDTRGAIHLRGIQLGARSSELSWSGGLAAELEARIYYSAAGEETNTRCGGRIDPRGINGSLSLRPPQGTKVPYQMTFSSPGSIEVPVSCEIGGFGTYNHTFEMGELPPQVNEGAIELGLGSRGSVELPGGTTRQYEISLVNPTLETNSAGIVLQTDVELSAD